MPLDWNDLKLFLAIARAGTLAGAAGTLGVNHSTVFRRLNACEARLGTRLFDRLAHGYLPTSAGEALVPRAERIETEVHAAERELGGHDVALEGTVRVTAAGNLAYAYLPGYLAALAERHPGIRVEVLVSGAAFDLSRREADVALRATTAPPEHLVGRRAVSLRWSVYASPGYLARHGRPASLAEVAAHRVIGADADMLRLPALAWLRRTVPAERVAISCNDLDAISAMAAAGLGLALLPADQVDPGLERVLDGDPAWRSELWLLTHPDLRAMQRVRVFMEFVAEALRADPRLGP